MNGFYSKVHTQIFLLYYIKNSKYCFYFQNNQVEEVTSILGTNTLAEANVEIIENSASGTNYFAKVS